MVPYKYSLLFISCSLWLTCNMLIWDRCKNLVLSLSDVCQLTAALFYLDGKQISIAHCIQALLSLTACNQSMSIIVLYEVWWILLSPFKSDRHLGFSPIGIERYQSSMGIPRVSERQALSTPTYIPGIFEYRTISHDITFRSQDFDLDHDQNQNYIVLQYYETSMVQV